MGNRRGLPVTAVMIAVTTVGMLSGCSPDESSPPPDATSEESQGPVPSSVAREVPPEQRVRLGKLSPERLCGLVGSKVLGELAFPVQQGVPREVGFDPPVRGCLFEATGGTRSVLISAQPDGLDRNGWQEADLGGVVGSKTLHANDCTVYAGVSHATLQVSVKATRADSEQCDAAVAIARYTLEALVR